MTPSTPGNHQIQVQDVEYLRHGDKPLLARIFQPQGAGPFPMMVSLHGGAWCRESRMTDEAIHEVLAKSGVVVASLDFRMPPDASYPGSMIDINYAIRWLKARAKDFNGRADRVGVMGTSSGGHQAMLTAMRPRDARYASLPLAGGADASVRCAILLWPVIDPLGRYRYAKELQKAGPGSIADRVLPSHDDYWKTEAAMEEGNPVMALERGEKTEMPPVLYLQATKDQAHPRPHLDRFVAAYGKAGGALELELYEADGSGFARKGDTPAGAQAQARIIEFVHKHC
ncbi:MAG: alpha/beta hydrolase [Candidatus Rokubacteria bacterium]|nr:alpha/beta hydrolase [Candidatus Rokubacteria bacterium]